MRKYLNLRANIALGLILAFLANITGPIPNVQGAEFYLPAPGVMVPLSPVFNPAVLKGIKLDPQNPFRFHFFVDSGDSKLSQEALKNESAKLIKYFLASLTIPEKDLWVNLSPYEKDRIVPQEFGRTEMGRDLLAEDYLLKQITASLIYPESRLGKEFWAKVYAQAQAKYGTTNIPINTFNKVWMVPDKAVVYENGGTAFVLENHLKVMLEEDYLSLSKHQRQPGDMASAVSPSTLPSEQGLKLKAPQGNNPSTNALGSQIIREIVIPALTKEVNEGKNFAQLRQVFYSLILATWYKKKIKDSILNKVYSDRNEIGGVNISARDKDRIYQEYLKAFKKGVYNYIKEEPDQITGQTTPRKYFSGGVIGIPNIFYVYQIPKKDFAQLGSPIEEVDGNVQLDHAMSSVLLPTAILASLVATILIKRWVDNFDRYFRIDRIRTILNVKPEAPIDARKYAQSIQHVDLLKGVYPRPPAKVIKISRTLMEQPIDGLMDDFNKFTPGTEDYRLTVAAMGLNSSLFAYKKLRDLYFQSPENNPKKKDLVDILRRIESTAIRFRIMESGPKYIGRRTWPSRLDASFPLIDPEMAKWPNANPLIIGDWAVSDGTSSMELAKHFQTKGQKARVYAYDKILFFNYIKIQDMEITFSDEGDLLQIKNENSDHLVLPSEFKPGDLAYIEGMIHEISKKKYQRVSLINPEAEEFSRRHPDLLVFEQADVFKPMNRKHHIIRVSGLLMRGSHKYFPDRTIKRALKLLGNSTYVGGSIINCAFSDNIVPDYYDVFHRREDALLLEKSKGYNSNRGWQRITLSNSAMRTISENFSQRMDGLFNSAYSTIGQINALVTPSEESLVPLQIKEAASGLHSMQDAYTSGDTGVFGFHASMLKNVLAQMPSQIKAMNDLHLWGFRNEDRRRLEGLLQNLVQQTMELQFSAISPTGAWEGEIPGNGAMVTGLEEYGFVAREGSRIESVTWDQTKNRHAHEWLMTSLRDKEIKHIRTEMDTMPLLKLAVKDLVLDKWRNKHDFYIGMADVNGNGNSQPVVVKELKAGEIGKDVFIKAQVRDRLGIGPRFYGLVQNTDGSIFGYAMQFFPGKETNNLVLGGKQNPAVNEIMKRAESAGIALETLDLSQSMIEPSGVAVLDAEDMGVKDQNKYNAFIKKCNEALLAKPDVVLLEKDVVQRDKLKESLERNGYRVKAFDDESEAVKYSGENIEDIKFVIISGQRVNKIETAAEIRRVNRRPLIGILSESDNPKTLMGTPTWQNLSKMELLNSVSIYNRKNSSWLIADFKQSRPPDGASNANEIQHKKPLDIKQYRDLRDSETRQRRLTAGLVSSLLQSRIPLKAFREFVREYKSGRFSKESMKVAGTVDLYLSELGFDSTTRRDVGEGMTLNILNRSLQAFQEELNNSAMIAQGSKPELKSILLVDDYPSILQGNLEMLKEKFPNAVAVTAGSVEEAEEKLKTRSFDAVVLDFYLSKNTAEILAQQISRLANDKKPKVVIVHSGFMGSNLDDIRTNIQKYIPEAIIVTKGPDLPFLKELQKHFNAAMKTQLGGIDLNPAQMRMQVKQGGQDFKFNFNGIQIDAAQVTGATFTIHTIKPVTNLPQILGLNLGPANTPDQTRFAKV